MKAIPCKLILCGKWREISMGDFKSISAAKKYVSECWNGPYYLIKVKNNAKI